MIDIVTASINDIAVIANLANQIWWPTYKDYIDKEQISLMLENMYSEDALQQQMHSGHIFLLTLKNKQAVGFASYSVTNEPHVCKLHKLYIHPDTHRTGLGKLLLKKVETKVLKQGAKFLELNVNRDNKAKLFYEKMGYVVDKEVDIPYYQFVLNDYVMRKNLNELS